jgi:hypothetical protein
MNKSKALFALAAMLSLPFVADQAMAQQSTPAASIIFVGTVDALEAVTLPSLTASPSTSVVEVDQVIKKPDAIALAQGDKVTVVTEGDNRLQQGARAVFFTDGWMFGESLAVRVLSWEPVAATAEAAASLDTRVAAQAQASADKDIRASVDSADLIVTGRVMRVTPPTAAALAPQQQIISEHNPDWQDATIQVQSVLKGASDTSQVVVRFPASNDVMWADYPRFTVGQEGTFLLHQDRLSGAPTAALEGRTVPTYTAPSPKSVLSGVDAEKIRSLLGR